jgi:hypothetical protein
LCLLCKVCTLRNGYDLQVTGSGHLFDCSPPLPLRSSLLFSRFCFPLLELTRFFCICWEFRFCCCRGFSILLATPALEIPAFAQHPSAEEENPSAEQKIHLLFSRGAWECGRRIWSSNCDFSSALRNSLEQIWALGWGRQTSRQTDRLGVLTLSQYLVFFFSCFLHATTILFTILFSLESHHHIPFVNCLVVVVVVVLLAFAPLSVLKQASSPYHSEASSVVSTLVIFS